MRTVFKIGIAGILMVLAFAISNRDSQAGDAAGCCTVTGETCSYSQQNCPPVLGMHNHCSISACS